MMIRLAGEVADGLMTHPTNTSARYLRERVRPLLEEGARRGGRERPGEIIASTFVATGATEADVAQERTRIRQFLGFLYSTPQYRATLDLHGWSDVGVRLHALSRESRWDELTAAITDEILDTLVPSGTYAEISSILAERYASVAGALTLRMPDEPGADAKLSKVVEDVKESGGKDTARRREEEAGGTFDPANPFTFDFSSDYRYLSYWNQPDLDEIDAGTGEANWVSLYLMDVLQGLQPIRYVEEFGLRLDSWSPDNQHFLYIYSPFGGPNLDRRMLSLGNVCQPPKELPVPEGSIIDATQWVDSSHFLAWTLPAEGISDSYPSGLYLYPLEAENLPIHIDDIVIDHAEPYGSQRQVVVLKH